MTYRATRDWDNLQRRTFPGVGAYDIPHLEPVQFFGDCQWIPFSGAATTRTAAGKGVHFLIDDYRFTRLCWARPVTIGNDCWFGANVVVCPGVTIGDGCVIGAGSVVTRDIPPHSFAAGNPCRVIRTLGAADSLRNRPELLGGYSVREVTGAHTALSKKGKKMKPSIAWFRS